MSQYKKNGFTLIELMVTVAILAILAGIGTPLYTEYMRNSDIAQARAEIGRLSTELESYRAKNFSYRGFTPTQVTVPRGATGAKIKYTISIFDGSDPSILLNNTASLGRGWVMTAIVNSSNTRLANKAESFLRNSRGISCENITSSLINARSSTCS